MQYFAPYQGFMRQAVPQGAQAKLTAKTLPAPTKGWVTNANMFEGLKGGKTALVLDNFFPESTGLVPRGGRTRHATIGAIAVERIFQYEDSTSRALFAADDSSIYDITSPGSPTVPPTALVSGMGNGYWSTEQMVTSGQTYLILVNGEDEMLQYTVANGFIPIVGTNLVRLHFDAQTVNYALGVTVTGGTSAATGIIRKITDAGTTGTLYLSDVTGTFQDNEIVAGGGGSATANGAPVLVGGGISSPNIAGAIVTDHLSDVWVHKNRLFFIERASMNMHYLPVDSVGGALGQKALNGIFKRGGALLFGATWSTDSGSGPDDLLVVVTTAGEAAVFAGANPDGSDPGDFDLVGRYDVTKPLGKNGTMSAGGDLLILTEDGVVPFSQALQKDPDALSLASVSRPIEPDWHVAVTGRKGTPWEIARWSEKRRAYVTVPKATDNDEAMLFVVNMESGAWCRYTGHDGRSVCFHNDQMYMGDREGGVWKLELTGLDDDAAFTCSYIGCAEHFGAPGLTKTLKLMRTAFEATLSFDAQMSASVDYKLLLPSPPSGLPIEGEGWDLSTWDVDLWDAAATPIVIRTDWVEIGETGFAHHPQVQITSSGNAPLDAKLIAIDVLLEPAVMLPTL